MKKMPELATRIIVGLIVFGIFLACIFVGREVGFLVLFAIALLVPIALTDHDVNCASASMMLLGRMEPPQRVKQR